MPHDSTTQKAPPTTTTTTRHFLANIWIGERLGQNLEVEPVEQPVTQKQARQKAYKPQ
jgi:hypothetical protein